MILFRWLGLFKVNFNQISKKLFKNNNSFSFARFLPLSAVYKYLTLTNRDVTVHSIRDRILFTIFFVHDTIL